MHTKSKKILYADDMGDRGSFPHIQNYLDNPMVQGPSQGYLRDPTKSILVIYDRNLS